MKYESELIKEIVDSRGHEKSSIHYESECIETWIEEAKGAYPKLCDYESEWLNYINDEPIGKFPYITLTDVTEATVDNVVPFAYQSAILKGNTLVNCLDVSLVTVSNKALKSSDGTITIDNTTAYSRFNVINNQSLIPSTSDKQFILFFHNVVGDISGLTMDNNGLNIDIKDNKYVIFKPNGFDSANRMFWVQKQPNKSTTTDTVSFKLTILEYQEGMENWDIPYFEGMKSVQMPVLTTTNEDGTNSNILTVNEDVELHGIGDVKDELNLLAGELTQRIGEVVLDGSEDWKWYKETTNTIVVYTNNTLPNHIGVKYTNSQMVTNYLDIVASTESSKDGCYISNTGRLNLVISKTKATSVNEIKQYLQSSPLVVQYLQKESVKTVELTVVNQDGESMPEIKPIEGTMHLSTSSDTIPPLFSGEIPVEAITQNLSSFIEEE